MSTLSIATVLSLALSCQSAADPQMIVGVAQVESGLNPLALHVNGLPTGTSQPQANSVAEAAAIATAYIKRGFSVDLGLQQINSRNLSLLGLGLADTFDPCANIAAGARLVELFSRYNTGSPSRGITNGYARAVMTKMHALKTSAVVSSNGTGPEPSAPVAVFMRPKPGHELIFVSPERK